MPQSKKMDSLSLSQALHDAPTQDSSQNKEDWATALISLNDLINSPAERCQLMEDFERVGLYPGFP
jgi:hypothetical protein